MQKLKNILKWVGIAIGLVLIIFIVIVGYKLIPTKAERLDSKNGPLGYIELLELAKTSKPNPDLYFSSQIKPDNPVFNGAIAFQRKLLDVAEKELLPLAEAGNAEAMFWYGQTTYRYNMLFSVAAGQWFKDSAKSGNLLASYKLMEPWSSDCERYLSDVCSEDWWDNSMQIAKQQSEQGDPVARYFWRHYNNKFRSADDYQEHINTVTEAAKSGYFAPLFWELRKFWNDKDISEEKVKAIAELLLYAANNNFVPAIGKLPEESLKKYLTQEQMQYFENLRAKMGVESSAWWISYSSYEEIVNSKDSFDQELLVKAYKYAYIEDKLFNYRDQFKPNREVDSLLRRLNENNIPPLNKQEQQHAEALADEFISNMTPVFYLDGLNPKGYIN